jgi:predicted ester cyclase
VGRSQLQVCFTRDEKRRTQKYSTRQLDSLEELPDEADSTALPSPQGGWPPARSTVINDMHVIDRTQALRAKVALEEVCSGARLASAPEFYSSHFVDHVNGAEHRGHEGIRRSVQAYARVLSDLRIDVKEQMVDTDRVTSRFTVTGGCYGRQVSFEGITISRFEGELIVEDWTVTDGWGLLKQLGVWRSLLIVLKS